MPKLIDIDRLKEEERAAEQAYLASQAVADAKKAAWDELSNAVRVLERFSRPAAVSMIHGIEVEGTARSVEADSKPPLRRDDQVEWSLLKEGPLASGGIATLLRKAGAFPGMSATAVAKSVDRTIFNMKQEGRLKVILRKAGAKRGNKYALPSFYDHNGRLLPKYQEHETRQVTLEPVNA